MRRYYCEQISDGKSVIYAISINWELANAASNYTHLAASNRVWFEDDDGSVSFWKYRGGDRETAKVDEKEFLFIKLRAIHV